MIRKIYIIGFLLFLTRILLAQQTPDSIVFISNGPQINMGYSSQNDESVSGAISSISGTELAKSPLGSLSETFVGRLYGRGVASINQSSYLVVVDGMITPRSYLELHYSRGNRIRVFFKRCFNYINLRHSRSKRCIGNKYQKRICRKSEDFAFM